ncbi:pimelyl-ACP methyl ester esterase [Lysobacter arseniciresistens ZS79]|uniref:Pimeloyl-[acyl-carrier protein] methyl ester esterase n=1 Tax=Lysobacter arseniciresistens ZS79 TaxID=913325 RepID=A0A0A0ERN0_9GAMM|nr:pimeloyl-ACP methyl ester esterase BioH [Lysobacter arseniciresistens]KGM53159.1 pimelyl-ACP methyl ester esterase [Lysobacter arseniciresistens ZS79]
MYIETHGRGPALALIHGWAMHGGLFAPLVERLADRHTLHLVDLPGHGHARDDDAPLQPDMLAAALVERVPDAVWLGWSLGGQVALRAALDHPGRVRGLVMVASSPRFVRDDAGGWPHGVSSSLFGDFGDALERDFRGTLEGFLALESLGSSTAQDELRRLRAQAFERGEPAPRALQEGLALLDAIDLRAELPNLRVPSLWISGRRDRLVPAGAMPAAAALAPGARSVVIDGAGHAPFLGAADRVADEIAGFMESLAAAGASA